MPHGLHGNVASVTSTLQPRPDASSPGNTPNPSRGVVLQKTPTTGAPTAPAMCKGALSLLTTTLDWAISAADPSKSSAPAITRGAVDAALAMCSSRDWSEAAPINTTSSPAR